MFTSQASSTSWSAILRGVVTSPDPICRREEADDRLQPALDALVQDGVVETLATDADETRAWMDCDLASVAENLLGEPVDPCALDPVGRRRLETRIAGGDFLLRSPHEEGHRSAFWLLEGGERVGTMALDNRLIGSTLVGVSSLYVLPTRRRSGTASRALASARLAVERAGASGLRVPTSWTWHATVRFYLARRLWVRNWKHELVFATDRHRLDWTLEIRGDEARFGLVGDRSAEPLLVATRRGTRLGWRELEGMGAFLASGTEAAYYAASTFALALAVEGWPLVRSDEQWAERHHHADGGDPEGLAYKIEVFEAIARDRGFAVPTPRIPGLAYRDREAID